MKHFYRLVAFIIVYSMAGLLFAQGPGKVVGKSIGHGSQLNSRGVHNSSNNQIPGFISSPIQPLAADVSENSTPLVRTCFTVEMEERLRSKFPGRMSNSAFEEKMSFHIASATTTAEAETVYKIPTIVHIVHNGEPVGSGSNISNEQVTSQFAVLNEDFRRLGAGFNTHPDGADINIEFVPVLTDPQGNLLEEPGIDRVFGYNPFYEPDIIEFEVKPNTQWDPDRFFNIWVLNFGGAASGLLGYAQFPTFSGLEGVPENGTDITDGVVIGYKYFGTIGAVIAPFDRGRTTTHEVGHWLGLRHIWGDGNCEVDDYCADTPNADGPNTSCEFRDSCPGEGADMIENYMDYSTDGCMNIFTNDQKLRIRTVLDRSPRRNSLLACQLASPVATGVNTSVLPRSWYQYTAAEDETIIISSIGTTSVDTKLSIYRMCNSLPVNVSDDILDTQQSQLSISLNAGETVKILWEAEDLNEPFNWQISSIVPAAGASCEAAVAATQGDNNIPPTSLVYYWFQYTPVSDAEKIFISSATGEFDVYEGTCNQLRLLKSANTSVHVYGLSSSESVFIAFRAQGGNFSFSLTSEAPRTSEACAEAVLAVEGQNVIPYTAPYEYWYTYTMPFDGQLNVRSADFPQGTNRLRVLKDCGGKVIGETAGSVVELSNIALTQGETVKIVWDSQVGEANFEWHLQSLPFTNGEICTSSKVAQAGMNHTDAAPQWFSYTVSKSTNLRITSVGLTDVDTHVIIKRACDGPITDQSDEYSTAEQFYVQAQLILRDLRAGEQVYILWSEKWSYEGFDWLLEELDPTPGEDCNIAKQALTGMNIVEYAPGVQYFSDIFWTKFTVPESGKTITAFADRRIDMAIFINDGCQRFTFVDSNQGKASAVDLPAGTEILILWDAFNNRQDFTWTLSIEDSAPGDVCAAPRRATGGINYAHKIPIWYDYVMSQDGSLKIDRQGDEQLFFLLLDECDGEIIFSAENAAFVSGLSEGQRVIIYLLSGYPFSDAEWSLDEIPAKQGDFCDNPLTASYGMNHSEYATQWFSFTPETTGNVKVSSRAFTFEDTDLYIYDGCNGTLLAQSDDIFAFDDFSSIQYFQSEALIENAPAGQPLVIKWAGTHSTAPFYWEITNDAPRQGDTCEHPLVAAEGVNNAQKPTPAWFSFQMPRDGSLILTTLGYSHTNTIVEVYDECNGNLLGSNDDHLFNIQSYLELSGLTEGQKVLIRWSNFFASEQYTFDWRLIAGNPEPGLVCDHAAVAQVGINVTPDYASDYYWFRFTMPDANKKLVIKKLGTTAGPPTFPRLGVTNTCDRTFDYAVAENEVVIEGLSSGEEVLIYWAELFEIGVRSGFEWELTVTDIDDEDICDSSIDVSPGVYRSDGSTNWYKYTIPSEGDVMISSSLESNAEIISTTFVEVYNGCTGNLIASDYSHFLGEVLIQNAEAGQTLFIKWSSPPPFQSPFYWTLNVESKSNHAPVLSDSTFYINSSPATGQVVGMVVANDIDGHALSYRISSGNDEAGFALDSQTGILSIADAAKVGQAQLPVEIEVSVTDNIVFTYATITIDVVTSINKGEQPLVEIFPNPASTKLFLKVPADLVVIESSIFDLTGRLMQRNDPRDRDVSLLDLTAGSYFLKLSTTKGDFQARIVIVR